MIKEPTNRTARTGWRWLFQNLRGYIAAEIWVISEKVSWYTKCYADVVYEIADFVGNCTSHASDRRLKSVFFFHVPAVKHWVEICDAQTTVLESRRTLQRYRK